MKAALLIILLASICLLHAGADEEEETEQASVPLLPDFDVQKLAGTWYPIAAVPSYGDLTDATLFDETLEPSEEGNVVIKLQFIKDETCQSSEVQGVHTEEPSIFTVPDSNAVIQVVDTDHESFCIVLHAVNREAEEMATAYTLYLSSRTKEVSDDLKARFKSLTESLGYEESQIVFHELAESCDNFTKDRETRTWRNV